MSKITIFQLGVVVFVICLSTQVVSENNTVSQGTNSTTNATVPTNIHSSSVNTNTNSTSPTGAGVSLHTGTFPVLIPVFMAASFLQRYC